MNSPRFNHLQLAGLSLLGGVLLWLGWPPLSLFPFLFIGFVPLLIVEDDLHRHPTPPTGWQLFGFSFLFFFTWNALSTWWIWNATPGGAIFALVTNSLLMTIPFMLFSKTKQKFNTGPGYLSLIAFWITFEFLHFKWELAWPWLTLGNGLAEFPLLIQWYEYSGTLGGSLWLLVINIFLFQLFQRLSRQGVWAEMPAWWMALKPSVALVFPIGLSFIIYITYVEKGDPMSVTIVQPNVDPYETSHQAGHAKDRMQNLLALSKEHITEKTDYLVWPESAIPRSVWLGRIDRNQEIQRCRAFLSNYPNIVLISGFSGYRRYDAEEPPTPTARHFTGDKCCYDGYNSALQLDTRDSIEVYHKSKLVPGVEQLPYPWLFSFLEPIASQMGGIMGSLGTQDEREVFFAPDSVGVAPAICYESVFGEYITRHINNGAEALFIVTNDGWWGNTAGYKQHKAYASLRAIETRRPVIRSANTGISCFIDQRGNIQQQTGWWQRAAISQTVLFNSSATFYTRFGDYLGRIAGLLSILFILVGFVQRRV